MTTKTEIYRYVAKKGMISERFDARLRHKIVQEVRIHWEEDGSISRVDIFTEEKYDK